MAYSETHDFAGFAAWTEIDLGEVYDSLTVDNQSADQILEVSLDEATVEQEIGWCSSWATSPAPGQSIWLRRKAGTGGVHNALVEGLDPPPEPTPPPTTDPVLEFHRLQCLADIDSHTRALIALGFVHDGKTLSLSDRAQLNLTNHYMNRAEEGIYPFGVNTLDDMDLFAVADSTDVEAMYATFQATVRGHLDTGTALKMAIRAATTQAELDAVSDERGIS